MRDLIIKVSASDEEAARFEGRMAMVVAVSEEERAVLYADINSVDDFIMLTTRALLTLVERLGTAAAAAPEDLAMLKELCRRAEMANLMHDRTRECLGRAIFVAAEVDKGRLQ